jgi:hypothetical protein
MRDFSVKSERIHTVNQLLKAYSLFEIDQEYVVLLMDKLKLWMSKQVVLWKVVDIATDYTKL